MSDTTSPRPPTPVPTPSASVAISPADTTELRAPLVIHPTVRTWLRIEGLAAFIAGLAIYGAYGGAWLLVVPLLLVPDLSMLGYLRDPRLGAFTYNLVHTWASGLVVLGLGVWSDTGWLILAGAILVAHVGMDRAAGYGLKLPSAFHDTHMGRIGKASQVGAGGA
jgi:hypothetical protein